MRELTPLAVLLGVLIGALFGAANAYIGLKVGMTISASIPAAVISMGVLRGILKRGTILENNMVQTIGSAGESLAAGMIFTIPALYIFGFDVKFLEMVLWGAIGGLMGVLMMVPLRRVLIVKEHGTLPYPEGVACAEVLESGQRSGGGAKTVFTGLGVGAIYELFRGLGFWPDKAKYELHAIHTEASLNASPALLGVGYILGPRIAGYMLGGAVLGWFVIIPGIAFFGADATAPVAPESTALVSQMSPDDMWNSYLRYIGAGAVVFGGLLSLIKSGPTILSSIWHVIAGSLSKGKRSKEATNRDLPLPLIVLALAGLGYAMYHFPQVRTGTTGAIVVLVAAFFFVTVSSRLVGLIGSSSNPISGMTIATLLATSLVFTYVLDWTDDAARFAAISVGALVCIAIAVAGDCSQDLKTGFLLKATPWKQQIGELIGVLSATAAIAGTIYLLSKTYGFDSTKDNALLAPQANIMKLLVDGVMARELPWTLIIMGMAAAFVVELLGLPALPFAVGLYLPLDLSTPIMVGGLVRWVVGLRRSKKDDLHDPGTLGASGLVAGEGLMGLMLAGVTAIIAAGFGDPKYQPPLADKPEAVVPTHFEPWLAEWMDFDFAYGLAPEVPVDAQMDEIIEPDDVSEAPPPDGTAADDAPDSAMEDAPAEAATGATERDLYYYNLLPLVFFGLLVTWLAVTAFRRPPPPPPESLTVPRSRLGLPPNDIAPGKASPPIGTANAFAPPTPMAAPLSDESIELAPEREAPRDEGVSPAGDPDDASLTDDDRGPHRDRDVDGDASVGDDETSDIRAPRPNPDKPD